MPRFCPPSEACLPSAMCRTRAGDPGDGPPRTLPTRVAGLAVLRCWSVPRSASGWVFCLPPFPENKPELPSARELWTYGTGSAMQPPGQPARLRLSAAVDPPERTGNECRVRVRRFCPNPRCSGRDLDLRWHAQGSNSRAKTGIIPLANDLPRRVLALVPPFLIFEGWDSERTKLLHGVQSSAGGRATPTAVFSDGE